MLIKNALVFGEDRKFKNADVAIEGMYFGDSSKHVGSDVIDATGLYAIPGFIDIHFHGCVGEDFCDAKEGTIQKMADYESSIGVTSICPATMTLGEEELMSIMSNAANFDRKSGSKLVGINMEGPFISEAKKGAQAAIHIRKCDIDMYHRLNIASENMIKLVDIAPENEGAMEFIDVLHKEVTVSIAHTTANYDIATEAFERGARNVTHLYNAMPPLSHRDPGVIGAAADAKDVTVELICDGIHIHPSIVRATFRIFGAERVILISDSMRACGLGDGEYTLGGQAVFVNGAKATLADGTIAGSVTNLYDCFKKCVKDMHVRLEDAITAATINPAKRIGVYDSVGSIAVGKYADMILIDKSLEIKAVFVNGEMVVKQM